VPSDGSGGGVLVFVSKLCSASLVCFSCHDCSCISLGVAEGSIVALLDWSETFMVKGLWPTKPWITGRTKECWPASMKGAAMCSFQKNCRGSVGVTQ
jgi:hypothetical protein